MDIARLLIASIVTPLIGAGLLWLVAPSGRGNIRGMALATTLVTLVLATLVVTAYPESGRMPDGMAADSFAVTNLSWFAGSGAAFDIRLNLGLDGLGLWLYGLSALLMVSAVLVSWEAIEDRPALFYTMLLLLEAGCLGVFAARDIILFYVFFEFTLIPLFFLIGIWGSEDRRYAAVKFFIFTLAGSLLTFLGLLAIVLWDSKTSGQGILRFSIPELTASLAANPIPPDLQMWIFLALFAGFAIKVPLFPLHTWLPLAHVQAPTAGSVILAGLLLKIGTYGFLRFNIPMLPEASIACMPWILWLSVIGIIYGALVALAQSDMKRLIAYSSVSHLGFVMLGLFAFNRLGVQGGALQMVNHGLSTGGLFAVIGMLYERYHTRDIGKLGGLARRAPWLTLFMLIFTFSSIGLPGMNGFVGEFMVLIGMFQRAFTDAPAVWKNQMMTISVLSVSGVVLGAWYMLYLVQRVFFGPLKEEHAGHDASGHGAGHGAGQGGGHGLAALAQKHAAHDDHGGHGHGAADELPAGVPDLKWREFWALAPLVVFIVWIGLQPNYFLKRMAPTLTQLTRSVDRPLHTDPQPQETQTARVAPAAAPTAFITGDSDSVR